MRRSMLAAAFCIAAWPCGAAILEQTPAQWTWPPFKTEPSESLRSSMPLPPVLVSAAEYGAGLTDALVDTDHISGHSAFDGTIVGARLAAKPQVTMRVLAEGRRVPIADVCDALVASAHRHDLPVPFFIRLIWQESRFDAHAVSRVGAQGVAQFMPATATQMGLNDPFDPIQAVQASARLLRDLIGQFGNLGLAAAAYNAGPKRIVDWLARRGSLPEETRNYVLRITGHLPDSWRNTKLGKLALTVPKRAPCHAASDFAANVEVPAPPPPPPKSKEHTRTPILARKDGKARGPSRQTGRVQVVIDIAHNHVGAIHIAATAPASVHRVAASHPAKASHRRASGRIQIAMQSHTGHR